MCNRVRQVMVVPVLVAVLILLSIVPAADSGSILPDEALGDEGLLSADRAELTFTVDFPVEQLRLEPIEVDGQYFVQPTAPGWATMSVPGAPALPYEVATIAAPAGAEVRIKVEPGYVRVVPLQADPVPVPTIRADWDWDTLVEGQPALPRPVRDLSPDDAVYGSRASYPGKLAEVVFEGQLREHRVVGVAAYPVQYEPASRTLRVYETLQVRVIFRSTTQAGANANTSKPESTVIEGLLDAELLNSGSSREWAAAAPLASQPVSWAPPVPGYRVYVQETGMYKLTYEDLDRAEVPVESLDPRTLRMYSGGQEVAIHVEDESDGVFDDNEQNYVLFYGEGSTSKYSEENVYWLTYGNGSGLRMATRDGTPSAGSTPSMHEKRLHLEQNVIYLPRLIGDERLERFVGDYVYPPSKPNASIAFSLPSPSSEPYTGTLRVALFGYLDSSVQPDHHVELYLNGHLLGDVWWDGVAWTDLTGEFNQSLLNAGANTIRVVSPNDTGVGWDLAYLDWAEVEYADTFTVDGDRLRFDYSMPGIWKYELDGFTEVDLVAFDLSDPAAVVWIAGGQVNTSGAGYSFTFSDSVTGLTEYSAMASSTYLSPERIEQDTPSDLQSTGNGADYVIVSHAAFAEAVAPLGAYRSSQGLRVSQVDVQDVYDEFGHGNVDVLAIRDFLAYTYENWQPPAPSYVLLVGDGHYDPKDYQGYHMPTYIPPYLAPVDPWIGETAADNLFVSLTDGDSLPDMMLGRLAVNTAAEATTVVSKTLGYEQNPPPGGWNGDLLFVADNQDLAGDFAQISEALIDCCLPDPYQPDEIYYKVTHETPADVKAAIIADMSAGNLFVNYIGHAGVLAWAHEGFFATTDFPLLANENRLPIMLPMTCYEGYYHYPYGPATESMAETILRIEGKGAVASWAPTGLGVATGHDQLNRGFFDAVFKDGVRTLGSAVMAGNLRLASTGQNLDLLDTYLIFGDPALHINALDADVQLEKTVEPTADVHQGDVLTYTLTFTNTGPAVAHSVLLTDVVPPTLLNPSVVYSSPNVYQKAGAPFVWEIEDLNAGSGGEIMYRGTVPLSSLPGKFTIVNEAEITMAEPDTDPSNNTASTSTLVAPPPPSVWALYLPLAARIYDPLLYDDFGDVAYDNAYNPSLWERAGHPGYDVRQGADVLAFGSGAAPGNSGADMYLIQPQQRSLREVEEFEAMLKFSSGDVGGYASVKLQISLDESGQGWWTQCALAAGDSTALAFSCDVSTYDGANRTTEYRTSIVPASFDTWYTARIEADPDTAQLSFYLDDLLIGTHLPQDASALLTATNLNPKVGVWNGATGITAARYVDQVRITPAR